MGILRVLTPADRALAARFAGPLDGEITEAEWLEADLLRAQQKADGTLERQRIERAIAMQPVPRF